MCQCQAPGRGGCDSGHLHGGVRPAVTLASPRPQTDLVGVNLLCRCVGSLILGRHPPGAAAPRPGKRLLNNNSPLVGPSCSPSRLHTALDSPPPWPPHTKPRHAQHHYLYSGGRRGREPQQPTFSVEKWRAAGRRHTPLCCRLPELTDRPLFSVKHTVSLIPQHTW